jgi:cytochrome c oxidase subunit II
MKKLFLFLMSVGLVAALAACGGGDDSSEVTDGGGGDNTVAIEASNWKFDKSEYTVPAGSVTVDFKSAEGYHGLQINGTDVKIDGEGQKTLNLEAGEYTLICSVPCGEGHADMEAKLVVE